MLPHSLFPNPPHVHAIYAHGPLASFPSLPIKSVLHRIRIPSQIPLIFCPFSQAKPSSQPYLSPSMPTLPIFKYPLDLFSHHPLSFISSMISTSFNHHTHFFILHIPIHPSPFIPLFFSNTQYPLHSPPFSSSQTHCPPNPFLPHHVSSMPIFKPTSLFTFSLIPIKPTSH